MKTFPIVGVGASAGGLEAFTQLLQHLPVDTGMAFVLVQHLDPAHESMLTQLLSRATSMQVQEVTNNLPVEPNHVYVIPPNRCLEILRGGLKLRSRSEQTRGAQHSIDSFLESLAQDRREQAIGVVLSGTASDGTLGLEAIKSEGGITFAQNETAKFDSMPRNAIAAGCVDFVLSPEGIANELSRIAQHPLVASFSTSSPMLASEKEREADQRKGAEAPLASGGHGNPQTRGKQARAQSNTQQDRSLPAEENGFRKVLFLLDNHCGVDFSLYKSSTIQRRVARRMVLNRQNGHADYATFLKGNSKELDALYSDVLISVTSFFRNPEAFETLKRKVFPALVAERRRNGPVRVWTLGCSTGQEAYSIAMAYAEFADRNSRSPKLQIFATDLNEALLIKARHGLYTKTLAQDLSPERLRRFFVEEEGGYRVNKLLREQVVFARQNVIGDPPFSRMDLISCRNLLIYLESDLHKKIIPAFHYALKPGGFLFLGASEAVGQFAELFQPADRKQKIFSRKATTTPPLRLPPPNDPAMYPSRGGSFLSPAQRAQVLPEGGRPELDAQREADRLSLSQFAPPGVVINAELQVLQFRGATSAFLESPPGKPSVDVLRLAREGLKFPLRAAIDQAKRQGKLVRRQNVRMPQNGKIRVVHLQVIPLKNLKNCCFLILFEDATKEARLSGSASDPAVAKPIPKKHADGKGAPDGRINELERDLSETRDFLQATQERFEASTDALQASGEELQSANEELQSINEELETSKEELESTNEELTTVNEEMLHRNDELNRLNSDLNNLHISINAAILVLGRDLTIRRFTVQAEKIFNLLPADLGRPMSGIRHNLDCQDLEAFVRGVIDTVSVREREVRDKEGHWYSMRARPYLTNDNKIDGAVLVLMDIDALKGVETALLQSEKELSRSGRAKDDFIASLSHELRTPLTPVLLMAAVLREDERLPSDAREQLSMIERNIVLEARLIDDLLDLTRVSHGKLSFRAEICDAHKVIDCAVEIVREDARSKGISIERALAAQHCRLTADPTRLQQIVWNVLRNAIKFTPQGGKISIVTRNDKIGNDEMLLRIEVTDSGIGIDPAKLKMIFLPFYQDEHASDHHPGGVGLGLAIASAMVDLHGGRISALSEGINRGATFVIELPGVVDADLPVSAASISLPDSRTVASTIGSLRLLLVEDHVNTLKTLSYLLRRDGHSVTTSTTIVQALAAAAADKFDVVISDLGLPDGTGTELMQELASKYGLRGIALTGYGTAADIAQAHDSGFVMHLVKPISVAELRRALARLAVYRN